MKSSYYLAELLFDKQFYIETTPALCVGVNEFEHYITEGWKKGYNPSATFDTNFYLSSNLDVARSGVCPLIHYAYFGIDERRLPLPIDAFGSSFAGDIKNAARRVIDESRSMKERARLWVRGPVAQDDVRSDIAQIISSYPDASLAGLIISLSHDNYTEISGGVQNCIADEERDFTENGYAYLHVCPKQPLPMLAEDEPSNFIVDVRINGTFCGAWSLLDLAREISLARPILRTCHLIVHHLLGFQPEGVERFIAQISPTSIFFWVHDFFSLCESYALLRNDVAFCHGPEHTSQECSVCCYGEARPSHFERFRKFLYAFPIVAIAPSQSALKLWRDRISFPLERCRVVPHGKLIYPMHAPNPIDSEPIKVGYLGSALYNKGWYTFAALARRHVNDGRFAFYHLGSAPASERANISFLEVTVTRDNRDAMTKAVRNLSLNVVVNWSLCFETFSFTTFEGMAGGALIVARRGAGNVFPAASDHEVNQGVACDDEEALFDLFEGDDLLEHLHLRRFWNFKKATIFDQYGLED